MNKLSKSKFNKICRTCLAERKRMVSVFKGSLPDMLKSCASVNILEGDGLPINICTKCVRQVNCSYRFQQICEKSEKSLRECLKINEDFTDSGETKLNPKECDLIGNLSTAKKDNTQKLNHELHALLRNNDCTNDPGEYSYSETVKREAQNATESDYSTEIFQERDITKNETSEDMDCPQERVSDNKTKTQRNKKHMCTVCGKRFSKKSWIEVHMRKHTGERPLICGKCGKAFYMPNSLSKHMLTHSEKRHKCNICGKAFTETFQLTVHMRSHTGEKPYICVVCGKGSTTNQALTVHMRTHTGEKPFQCNQCSDTFASQSRLIMHKRRHSGQKPYACPTCGHSFLQKGDLDTHIRYHTGERPYACKVCPKKFFANGALRAHMMGHTGEKPHACSVCQKRFISSYNLKTHMRTHTGEKPYTCQVCGHRFSQSGALNTHIRGHKK